ncbi:protein of unknown function [endosymbiont DhMRE of Dentiscutata heterogama]|uniref:hypothetical protein n=1 Tax=endosymbiont DhMRE of Dentiscutata heterogama TaxID=1609546 RepID=UPI000629D35F|nr:hypothetical protein [endosymbiont DhMRE of Dentiscutata heterogama]CFW92940.1 protein of unknown function [endosymbiont DhMRE of Dentiscutata heterogama]
MSHINKNSKDAKFSNNYNEIIKNLSLILDEKETDDTKKKSKKLATLLSETKQIVTQKEEKEKEVQAKVDEKKEANNIGPLLTGTKREKARFTTAQTIPTGNWVANDKTGWTATWDSFIGTSGAADPWRGSGWNAAITAHYPSTYKDNLYKIQGQTFSTTEEQALQLLARAIYELGKIDKADLVAKHGLSGTDKTNLENWYDHIKTQSDAIEAMNKDLTIKTWDLPQTYSKEQALGAATAHSTALDFDQVFNFLEKLDDTLINKLNQDNITKLETWKIAKQGQAYTADELEAYGILLADKTKTTLYKSTKQKGGRWVKDEYEVKIRNGLKDWTELAKLIFADNDNKTKIKNSFHVSPNQYLFTDLRSQTSVSDPFKNGGHDYRIFESEEGVEKLEEDLETKKLAACFRAGQLDKEISDGQKEIDAKQKEINAKDVEIKALVGEILTKKREALANYNISKGFAKTPTEDNRREVMELVKINQLLLEIRYLENDGDATTLSSVTEENTALTAIGDIIQKVFSYSDDCYLVQAFNHIGWNKDTKKSEADLAISRIKVGKYTENGKEEDVSIYGGLENFKTHFENKEKLVKLNEWEKEALKAIELAINNQDNQQENLTDWQTKLKALDSTLDETLITETWKTKWGQVKKHGKLAEVETLLKKVIGSDGKVKKEFITEIKNSDSSLVDLKSLLQKEPKDIITYIARFTYNQLDDSSPEEKNKKKTQMKRRIAKKLNKTKESELKEEELNDSLYKIEIGEMILDTKHYKADLTEITTSDTPQQDDKPKWYQWGSMTGKLLWIGSSLTLVGGLVVVIFWKQIKNWWQGPEAVEESSADTTEVEEDDKE